MKYVHTIFFLTIYFGPAYVFMTQNHMIILGIWLSIGWIFAGGVFLYLEDTVTKFS
jgi:hypothetical protein